MSESIDRTAIMRSLRAEGVPDAAIGRAFGLSRQRIGAILGLREYPPKPPPEPLDITASARLPGALKAWRLRRGMTQREAAATLGVDAQTLNGWETARKGCSLATTLLRYLDITDEMDRIAIEKRGVAK